MFHTSSVRVERSVLWGKCLGCLKCLYKEVTSSPSSEIMNKLIAGWAGSAYSSPEEKEARGKCLQSWTWQEELFEGGRWEIFEDGQWEIFKNGQGEILEDGQTEILGDFMARGSSFGLLPKQAVFSLIPGISPLHLTSCIPLFKKRTFWQYHLLTQTVWVRFSFT